MIPINYVLALALVSTPPAEYSEAVLQLEQHQYVLKDVYFHMELIDPREMSYFFTRQEDFLENIKRIYARYEEVKGAPPLADAMRFPSKEICADNLALNRQYASHIEKHLDANLMREQETFSNIKTELKELYQIWDTIREAQSTYYYITVRRRALLKARKLLGDKNYYDGIYPPPVPLWRFESIR